MSVLKLAMTFFIITNPIGNSPAIIALIKGHPIRDQQKILLRESLFAMLLAIFFLFLGELFLKWLNIQMYALRISGGMILLIVALRMIFSYHNTWESEKPKNDPFIVPIATPLLSGAGLLTMIMLYSKEEGSQLILLMAILLAWVGITGILLIAPYMQIFFGQRGLAAMEQLMGMLLAMLGIDMMVQGCCLFINVLSSA